MNTVDWMTVFSANTLASWMAAGVVGIFGAHEELRHPAATRAADLLMAGFMVIGAASTIAMIRVSALF